MIFTTAKGPIRRFVVQRGSAFPSLKFLYSFHPIPREVEITVLALMPLLAHTRAAQHNEPPVLFPALPLSWDSVTTTVKDNCCQSCRSRTVKKKIL
jgi:hypothetical protein